MTKLRPLGEITDDLEPLLQEFSDHKMQLHEIIGLISQYYETHDQSVFEEYADGTRPIYGHRDWIK